MELPYGCYNILTPVSRDTMGPKQAQANSILTLYQKTKSCTTVLKQTLTNWPYRHFVAKLHYIMIAFFS